MFNGNISRKLISYKKVERIPANVRRRVIRVYKIIDKIELLYILPYYLSMLAPVVVFLSCSSFKWPKSLLLLISFLTVSYVFSIFLLKYIFGFFIKKKTKELLFLVKGRFKYRKA